MNLRYLNFLFFCFHFSFLFFFYKISLLLFFTDRVLIRFRWPKHKKLIFIYTLHLSLNVFATITWRNSVSIIQHFNEGPLISISTLSSFPTYFFSLFPILVEMANRIGNYKETFYREGLVRNLNSIWLIGLKFVNHCKMGGWVSRT